MKEESVVWLADAIGRAQYEPRIIVMNVDDEKG